MCVQNPVLWLDVPLLSASKGTPGSPVGGWEADLAVSRLKMYLVSSSLNDYGFCSPDQLDRCPEVLPIPLRVYGDAALQCHAVMQTSFSACPSSRVLLCPGPLGRLCSAMPCWRSR